MMCVLGTTNSFAVTIEAFLIPFKITSVQSGIALALTVVMGLAGAVLSSIYSTTKASMQFVRHGYTLAPSRSR